MCTIVVDTVDLSTFRKHLGAISPRIIAVPQEIVLALEENVNEERYLIALVNDFLLALDHDGATHDLKTWAQLRENGPIIVAALLTPEDAALHKDALAGIFALDEDTIYRQVGEVDDGSVASDGPWSDSR